MLFRSTARGNIADNAAAAGAARRYVASRPSGMVSQIAGEPPGKTSHATEHTEAGWVSETSPLPSALPTRMSRSLEWRQQLQRQPRAVDRELIHRERENREQRDGRAKASPAPRPFSSVMKPNSICRPPATSAPRRHQRRVSARRRDRTSARRAQNEPHWLIATADAPCERPGPLRLHVEDRRPRGGPRVDAGSSSVAPNAMKPSAKTPAPISGEGSPVGPRR